MDTHSHQSELGMQSGHEYTSFFTSPMFEKITKDRIAPSWIPSRSATDLLSRSSPRQAMPLSPRPASDAPKLVRSQAVPPNTRPPLHAPKHVRSKVVVPSRPKFVVRRVDTRARVSAPDTQPGASTR